MTRKQVSTEMKTSYSPAEEDVQEKEKILKITSKEKGEVRRKSQSSEVRGQRGVTGGGPRYCGNAEMESLHCGALRLKQPLNPALHWSPCME